MCAEQSWGYVEVRVGRWSWCGSPASLPSSRLWLPSSGRWCWGSFRWKCSRVFVALVFLFAPGASSHSPSHSFSLLGSSSSSTSCHPTAFQRLWHYLLLCECCVVWHKPLLSDLQRESTTRRCLKLRFNFSGSCTETQPDVRPVPQPESGPNFLQHQIRPCTSSTGDDGGKHGGVDVFGPDSGWGTTDALGQKFQFAAWKWEQKDLLLFALSASLCCKRV